MNLTFLMLTFIDAKIHLESLIVVEISAGYWDITEFPSISLKTPKEKGNNVSNCTVIYI